MRTSVSWVVAVSLAAVCQPVHGEEPKADPAVAELVQQLGSKAFADREAAEKQLVALGPKAKAAVLAGTRNADPEVARRCETIVRRIRGDEIEAFVAERADWTSPLGKKFRDIAGDSKASRKLFAEVLKADVRAALVEGLGDTPKEAATAYATELARLQAAWKDAFASTTGRLSGVTNGRMFQVSRRTVEPGDVALVLLLGAVHKADAKAGPVRLYEVLSANFMDLARGPFKQPFQKLFLAWLDRQTEPEALANGLEAALWAPIPEVAPVARRVVNDPKKVGTRLAAQGLLALGHHGTREDLARLSAFRSDARVYHVYRRAGGEPLVVQVRDVAAVMSLKLRGEDASRYGFRLAPFTSWWSEPVAYDAPSPLQSSEARTAAHTKAWDWLDEQPGAPRPAK